MVAKDYEEIVKGLEKKSDKELREIWKNISTPEYTSEIKRILDERHLRNEVGIKT